MRLTTPAITLALLLCCTAAAQVTTLRERDTANDACKRFKMRVLMPADVGTKPRPESAGPVDPRIVWNPCGEVVVHFAVIPFGGGRLPARLSEAPSFRLLPTRTRND